MPPGCLLSCQKLETTSASFIADINALENELADVQRERTTAQKALEDQTRLASHLGTEVEACQAEVAVLKKQLDEAKQEATQQNKAGSCTCYDHHVLRFKDSVFGTINGCLYTTS